MYNLESIIRKETLGFIGRLCRNCYTIVQTLENAWIIRIQLWHTCCILTDDTFDGNMLLCLLCN